MLISLFIIIKEAMIHIEICDKIPSTFECPTSHNDKRFICSRFKIKTGISPTYWLFMITHYGVPPNFIANFGITGCKLKIWSSFTKSIN